MTGRPTDERAPLLERDDQVEAGDTAATPQQKRTWWTVGWYTVFALLGAFILGVFVKGVIDSDDVDVSTSFAPESKGRVRCIAPTSLYAYMRSLNATLSSGRGRTGRTGRSESLDASLYSIHGVYARHVGLRGLCFVAWCSPVSAHTGGLPSRLTSNECLRFRGHFAMMC